MQLLEDACWTPLAHFTLHSVSIHWGIANQNVNHRILSGREAFSKLFSADHKEVKKTDCRGDIGLHFLFSSLQELGLKPIASCLEWLVSGKYVI